MADYDNDGWLDIYVSNGGPSNVLINDIVEEMPPSVQFYIAFEPATNALLRNNGDGTFSDVTEGSGASGFSIGAGVASGDVNGDGFADIVGTARTFYNRGEMLSDPQRNFLWLNQGNGNHWIKVRLEGQRLNARIRVASGDLVQWREIFSSTGYKLGRRARAHFRPGKPKQRRSRGRMLGKRPRADRAQACCQSGSAFCASGRRLPVARRHDPDDHGRHQQQCLRAGDQHERRPGRRGAKQFATYAGGANDAQRAEHAQHADHRAPLARRRFLAHQRHAAHHGAGHGHAQHREYRQHSKIQRRFHEIN